MTRADPVFSVDPCWEVDANGLPVVRAGRLERRRRMSSALGAEVRVPPATGAL